jgi:TatA/E family protein of Tat protein translocase
MGFSETIFLFFLALLIFGPKKLPEIARQIGKAMNEFRRASNEFKSQIQSEISQLETENHQQILPPSQPPQGAVAALPATLESTSHGVSLEPTPERHFEAGSQPDAVMKAPDA